MSVTNLPDPEDRDLYEQLFRNRTKGLAKQQIEYLVDLALDPKVTVTAKGIARDIEVSIPSGKRYRDMIMSARERGPQAVLDRTNPEADKPTPEVSRRAARRAMSDGAKIRKKLKDDQERLSADDMSLMVDRWIRKLDNDPNATTAQIKPLLEFKAKFEDVQNTGQELIIDPMKQLGPDGLSGIAARFNEHMTVLSKHRFELAAAWGGIVKLVLGTLAMDIGDLGEGENLPYASIDDLGGWEWRAPVVELDPEVDAEDADGASNG